MTKISQKPKNDKNIPKTQKMTKIPPKPKNYQNTLKTHMARVLTTKVT